MPNLLKKFKRAFVGVHQVLWPELSVKIELAVGLAILALAYFLPVSRFEFLGLVITVFGILLVEALNTVVERMIDLVEPRYHDTVRQLKDVLAGLVLLAIAIALLIGLIIFWPYLKEPLVRFLT